MPSPWGSSASRIFTSVLRSNAAPLLRATSARASARKLTKQCQTLPFTAVTCNLWAWDCTCLLPRNSLHCGAISRKAECTQDRSHRQQLSLTAHTQPHPTLPSLLLLLHPSQALLSKSHNLHALQKNRRAFGMKQLPSTLPRLVAQTRTSLMPHTHLHLHIEQSPVIASLVSHLCIACTLVIGSARLGFLLHNYHTCSLHSICQTCL